jgi:hypothetical protein
MQTNSLNTTVAVYFLTLTKCVTVVPSPNTPACSSNRYPCHVGMSLIQRNQYTRPNTITLMPTTAYVAYHIPRLCSVPFGGKNGAALRLHAQSKRHSRQLCLWDFTYSSAKHSVILNTTATRHALNGRLRSGRLIRSHNRPMDEASANI